MRNQFSREIRIGSALVRDGACFVIAEAGINHNGDMVLAKQLIDAAKAAGADAVKFQTFKAGEEVTRELKKVAYQRAKDDTESYFDMIKRLEFNEAQHRELIAYCAKKDIVFLSTPSEETSARMLHRLGVPAFKIGSNDLVTTPMLEEIASWKKPIILSTGMAGMNEIAEALQTVTDGGNNDIVLLQCTSSYPTPPHELNVRVIETLRNTFGCLVGFSDHSADMFAAPLAVLLGAVIVETHITLDRNLPGPDQRMALEPPVFSALVAAIRRAEYIGPVERKEAIARISNADIMLGAAKKEPTSAELEMRKATRKGIVARRAIMRGETLAPSMLAYKRPYHGIPARLYKTVLGKRAICDIEADKFLTPEMLA